MAEILRYVEITLPTLPAKGAIGQAGANVEILRVRMVQDERCGGGLGRPAFQVRDHDRQNWRHKSLRFSRYGLTEARISVTPYMIARPTVRMHAYP